MVDNKRSMQDKLQEVSDIARAAEGDPIAIAKSANRYKKYLYYVLGCGCLALVFWLILGGAVALGFFVQNNEGDFTGPHGASDFVVYTDPEGLSDIVPPLYASLFTEAGNHSGVAPALIAAVFLTERHSDTFGADLPNLSYKLEPCTENGSGAAGPMQFIPSSWNGIIDDLQGIGISNPDRCRYRDSIIGAGFLLAGKVKFDSVQAVCKTDSSGEYIYTDVCVSTWGQAYCGVGGCDHKNCGYPSYLYCEEVLRKYKLVVEK